MSAIVDLSLTYQSGMRGVEIEPHHEVAKDGWNSSTLRLYSHAGTHMDAQTHFDAGSESVDLIEIGRCIGPAWVIDIRKLSPKSLIEVDHLGVVPEYFNPGDSLLFLSGWSRHVHDPEYYRNHFPRISPELAMWCVDAEVKMLGVESPSVADVNDLIEVTDIHKILLSGNVVIVEGLAGLNKLTEPKVIFVAAPLKISDGDGAPCRAFAIQKDITL